MKQLDLEKDKIGKLLMTFSVPCIISLLVNALYNMVDQIFIGWGVGYLGNGATNIIFPITVLCLSFALMFGDGTSAYLSLKLGEKKEKEAEKRSRKWNYCISYIIYYIRYSNFYIFAKFNYYIWRNTKFKKLCNGLWLYYYYWNSIYDDRNNIKFNYKSRWLT